jgi:hypothetical protein
MSSSSSDDFPSLSMTVQTPKRLNAQSIESKRTTEEVKGEIDKLNALLADAGENLEKTLEIELQIAHLELEEQKLLQKELDQQLQTKLQLERRRQELQAVRAQLDALKNSNSEKAARILGEEPLSREELEVSEKKTFLKTPVKKHVKTFLKTPVKTPVKTNVSSPDNDKKALVRARELSYEITGRDLTNVGDVRANGPPQLKDLLNWLDACYKEDLLKHLMQHPFWFSKSIEYAPEDVEELNKYLIEMMPLHRYDLICIIGNNLGEYHLRISSTLFSNIKKWSIEDQEKFGTNRNLRLFDHNGEMSNTEYTHWLTGSCM